MCAIKTNKAMKSSELFKRRFKLEVRMAKKRCEQLGITLLRNGEHAIPLDYVCILSKNDYDKGLFYQECDKTTESYFIRPEDYELYSEYI